MPIHPLVRFQGNCGHAVPGRHNPMRLNPLDLRLAPDPLPEPTLTPTGMFTRINFLLGFGLLTAIAFYFIGSYVVVRPLSGFAPGWVRPVAGIFILAALGLTVQILSMVQSGMDRVADPGVVGMPATVFSQIAITCGHAGLGYTLYGFLSGLRPVADPELAVAAALYLAGLVVAIRNWRRKVPGA